MTGSRKHELKSKQKLEKKLSFYTKVKDTVTSLNAKKAISKKKKQRSRQKKLKAYDFSALSEFLPETGASQQQTEATGVCSTECCIEQSSVSARPIRCNSSTSGITQPPSSVKGDDSAKHGKKSRKDKRRKKNNASSITQSMDI